MKKSFFLLLISTCFLVFSSCSNDDASNPVIGSWKLITWSIAIPVDLNSDSKFSTNLLDEIACDANEILSFDAHGLAYSSNTFNPELSISLKDDTSDEYIIDVTCDEGSIGFATEYAQIGQESVSFNDAVGVVSGSRLSIVYPNAIKVYNETFTEVVETKNLTLIYEKN
ncbi:hypothetical protein [uncultured Gelidibacter sp.]|uniref:hypothetical protein n=1 Tax=uncultured Gelidibacter sp. TaxID=259318 RepID=UPI002626127E|nr:hypothetical protein [uncultured Gelidibacter sp.]